MKASSSRRPGKWRSRSSLCRPMQCAERSSYCAARKTGTSTRNLQRPHKCRPRFTFNRITSRQFPPSLKKGEETSRECPEVHACNRDLQENCKDVLHHSFRRHRLDLGMREQLEIGNATCREKVGQ